MVQLVPLVLEPEQLLLQVVQEQLVQLEQEERFAQMKNLLVVRHLLPSFDLRHHFVNHLKRQRLMNIRVQIQELIEEPQQLL
jgi:hypothetical protein